ncbi:hypothetical protein [Vogesella mureinivorans]|jgi:uncharacterized lipoprotein YmbA|uniref:hypothetical protein n=1 Tax=Vogesella mureinivorans TaxID=657276 RepID=UPI0011CADFC6|nr:hypothetical protein [Vogesella mureinivorans]
MKKLIIFLSLLWLAGCAALPGLGASQAADSLMREAQQLAPRVAKGELTRVQVADRLDALRQQQVGRNAVDDDLFRTYRRIAQQRDAGQIDSARAQKLMEDRLQLWQRRWPALPDKPAQPAFAHFLFKLYGLPPLGATP